MFGGLFIASIIGNIYQATKEAFKSTVPAENWANNELYYQDLVSGVSAEQRMKNVKNGRYKMTATYPEPHRDKDGKIIIENYNLYKEDLMKYGSVQTMNWVKQGKYNLPPEELEKEYERIKDKYDNLYGLI